MDDKAMKTYEVQTTKTVTELATVVAENEEMAIAEVGAGRGVNVDNQLTVTRTAHERPPVFVPTNGALIPSEPLASSQK